MEERDVFKITDDGDVTKKIFRIFDHHVYLGEFGNYDNP